MLLRATWFAAATRQGAGGCLLLAGAAAAIQHPALVAPCIGTLAAAPRHSHVRAGFVLDPRRGEPAADDSRVVVLDGLLAECERAALLAWLTADGWDHSRGPPQAKWERACVDREGDAATWGLRCVARVEVDRRVCGSAHAWTKRGMPQPGACELSGVRKASHKHACGLRGRHSLSDSGA